MSPSGAKRLQLAPAASDYDRIVQASNNRALTEADRSNFKKFEDIDLANDERLILVSANGTRYKIVVSDAGALSTSTV
tara:strand:+ start:2299 stop:2532 length:234 start_codon:yes stop_codon:yes gene_type:complete